MKTALCFVALTALLGVAGCTSSSAVMVGQARPEIDPSAVRLYLTPPARFEDIALLSVEASGMSEQGEANKAVAALKEQAAKLGANGVLLASKGTTNSGAVGQINPQTGSFYAATSTFTTMAARAIWVIQE